MDIDEKLKEIELKHKQYCMNWLLIKKLLDEDKYIETRPLNNALHI